VYDYSNKKTLKNRSNAIPTNAIPTNTRPPPQPVPQNPLPKTTGGTRKNQEIKKIYLGKHSKTRKPNNK
jgi:hypothetical protein